MLRWWDTDWVKFCPFAGTQGHIFSGDLHVEINGWAESLLLRTAGTTSEPQLPSPDTGQSSPARGFEGCQRSPAEPILCPDTSQRCTRPHRGGMKAFPQGPSSVPWEILSEQGHSAPCTVSMSNSPASVSTHTSPLSLRFFPMDLFLFFEQFCRDTTQIPYNSPI